MLVTAVRSKRHRKCQFPIDVSVAGQLAALYVHGLLLSLCEYVNVVLSGMNLNKGNAYKNRFYLFRQIAAGLMLCSQHYIVV